MSEIAALPVGRSFLSFGGTTSGASPDASRIPSQYVDFVRGFIFGSATGSERIGEPRQEIYDVYNRSRERNWNGQDAEAISLLTAVSAEELLLAIPSHYPTPEIFADPTGAISFEWYRRPKYRLVISIYDNGSIEFAALLGAGNEVYGTARMDDGLPVIIQDNLKLLFTQWDAKGKV